jgi:hypothetical protein
MGFQFMLYLVLSIAGQSKVCFQGLLRLFGEACKRPCAFGISYRPLRSSSNEFSTVCARVATPCLLAKRDRASPYLPNVGITYSAPRRAPVGQRWVIAL